MKKVIVISTSLRHGSNSDMLAEKFSQMRICHMYAGADEISFGIYACSPEESSFTAVFSDMKITECAWMAHDGQQPDKK